MNQHISKRRRSSSVDYDFYRRRYAHVWQPGCERVQCVVRLLESRGIRYEADGFMADSIEWARTRPEVSHVPDIRILAA